MDSAQVNTVRLNPQSITEQKPQIPDLSHGRAVLKEGLTKLVFHPLEPTYQQALCWGGGIVLLKRQKAKEFQNVSMAFTAPFPRLEQLTPETEYMAACEDSS